jgi:membrane associated rhomboid family serine protease
MPEPRRVKLQRSFRRTSKKVTEDHLDFMHALWARRTPFTYIFLAVNISIFVVMEFAGGTTNDATLMAFGVKSNAEIDRGEVWRLLTPVFIHIGLLHLFFNSYALWMVGPQVEKLYGSARFVLLYALTGVAGVLGSYFYHPDVVSAGASGAIFGLFGVLAVFGLKYRKTIPPFFKRAVGAGVLPVIAINLVIGFSIPAIDNAAHISGLAAGGLLAFLLRFQEPGAQPTRLLTAAQLAVLLAVSASFYEVATNYDGPSLSFQNLSRGWGHLAGMRSSSQEFIEAVNTAQQTFRVSADQLDEGNVKDLESLKTATAAAIDALEGVPSLGAEPDRLTSKLLRLMEDHYQLITDIERAGTMTFAHNQRLKGNTGEFRDLTRDFSGWIERDGRKFGIQMGKRP